MPLLHRTATALALCPLALLAACQMSPPREVRSAPSPRTQAMSLDLSTKTSAHPTLVRLAPREATPADSAAAAQPQPSQDLWARVRGSFQLQDAENPRIQTELNWYLRHEDYLGRVQERARPYLYHIAREAARRGVPGEIVLLPVVESAFQPFAYSPGRAAGIWQFIPSTGRMFKLKQNWWYDGRRDVIASTRAAFELLQRLHKQFDGDWLLALAAYNSGGGTVSRAIRKNRKRGRPTDFWSLDLPRETRAYVPRLLAISRIVADPQAFDVQLETFPYEPFFAEVDIGSQLDLALAADMAGIPIDELYRLNPGFNRWATDPDGPHRLLLPIGQVKGFEQKLAALEPDKRLRWERHKIRQGETLGHIAQRYGTTVKLLQQVNHLRGNRIRAGKHLLIPVSTKQLKHYALSADQRLAKTRSAPRKGQRRSHTVQPGDTLWDIARDHDVKLAKLARWNGMAPGDVLRPGQKLVIWSTSAAKPVSSTRVKPVASRQSVRYTVRRGDSLYGIAQRFRVSVVDLRKWNTLPGKYLQPGQKIKLYVDVTEQAL